MSSNSDGRDCDPGPSKVPRRGDEESAIRQTRRSLPGLDIKKCLFCQQEKRPKGKARRRPENLYRCTWDCTPDTLRHAARIRQDKRVLLEIDQGDLHAKDILYHRSCYKQYTSRQNLKLVCERKTRVGDDCSSPDTSSSPETSSPHERAFARLAWMIDDWIEKDTNCLMKLTSLCTKYVELLAEEGENVASYRGDQLKRRLLEHYGERLRFHRPFSRSEAHYVFSAEVQAGPLIEKCMKLEAAEQRRVEEEADLHPADMPDHEAIDQSFLDTSKVTVYGAAVIIRQAILSMRSMVPFPHTELLHLI